MPVGDLITTTEMVWRIRLKGQVTTSEVKMVPVVNSIPRECPRWQAFLDRLFETPGLNYKTFAERVRAQQKKSTPGELTLAFTAGANPSDGLSLIHI